MHINSFSTYYFVCDMLTNFHASLPSTQKFQFRGKKQLPFCFTHAITKDMHTIFYLTNFAPYSPASHFATSPASYVATSSILSSPFDLIRGTSTAIDFFACAATNLESMSYAQNRRNPRSCIAARFGFAARSAQVSNLRYSRCVN